MKVTRRTALKALTAALGAGALADLDGTDPAEGLETDVVTTAKSAKSDVFDTMLWYRQPAATWLEALPVGNGRLGAMIFGGVPSERIQLNESSLWSGSPHDYDSPDGKQALPEIRRLIFAEEWRKAQDLVNARFLGRPARQASYQTVGNLNLAFTHSEPVSDYRRELQLDTAITSVTYTSNNVRYRREYFISVPDQVLVLRLTADSPGKISLTTTFDTPQKATSGNHGKDTLFLQGTGGDTQGIPGSIPFHALARLVPEGGILVEGANSIAVNGADAVTLLLSIATGYNSYADVSGNAQERAEAYLAAAARKSYARLRQAHLADYQPRFRRVSLTLGGSDTPASEEAMRRPTNERVAAFKEGKDPQLAALHFQFGRYLLLSCSRPGGQPATLQGLWNDSVDPPWGSKYTININTEMNYWPAGPANLLECYAPLFQMLEQLATAGERTAQTLYGARGWVCHHNTDIWRGTAPVDGSYWGMWPTGGAWLSLSMWDHYLYTQDKAALRKAYPILKGAAEFFLDTLVEEPKHGWLVTCPSISPEHGHHQGVSICAGPTMDMQILRDLFDAVTHSSEILATDREFRQQIRSARARLAPMQIGNQGQLQEWMEDWDAGAEDIHHRHVSHLYGLFPSQQITRRATPELFAAAKKSLEIRGDAATGWSLAWKINLWARLEEGDRAYKLLTDLLTPERTAPNLFDLHPPFQIDGNFGAVSGIGEMLMQSHSGEIHLLPALPSAWPSGAIRGLRARGGFTVDVAWQNGRLSRAMITSIVNTPCTARYGERTVTFAVEAGKRYMLDSTLKVRTE